MSLVDKIFYVREAVTLDDKLIRIYKLRTMISGAHLMWLNYAQNNLLNEFGKVQDDQRITNLGKVLRKYWIDELPQIYHLLKGDLRLVGIRPKPLECWEKKPQQHKKRCLQFKPALIGINYVVMNRNSKLDSKKKVVAIERLYCMQKKKNPILTDIKFGSKALYNILFRGLRSS